MGIRRQGREFALKIIYSLQDQEEPVETILADFWRNFRFQNDILGEPIAVADGPLPFEVRRFAEELILGVAENLEKIDQVIEEH
jgi:N utilization substance protein B